MLLIIIMKTIQKTPGIYGYSSPNCGSISPLSFKGLPIINICDYSIEQVAVLTLRGFKSELVNSSILLQINNTQIIMNYTNEYDNSGTYMNFVSEKYIFLDFINEDFSDRIFTITLRLV